MSIVLYHDHHRAVLWIWSLLLLATLVSFLFILVLLLGINLSFFLCIYSIASLFCGLLSLLFCHLFYLFFNLPVYTCLLLFFCIKPTAMIDWTGVNITAILYLLHNSVAITRHWLLTKQKDLLVKHMSYLFHWLVVFTEFLCCTMGN